LLSSETIAPKTNKSLTTTYEYDRFGNKTKSTITINTKSTTTGSGIDGSSTTIKYSADGKFPIKTTNALGHFETKTENKSASIKINPLVVKQNERSKFENKNATVKTNPSVVKQNDQSKFKEEIKKILKKALISAHKNGKYEVAELTKKNQQSFDEFKNSLIKSQESNNHKILSKVNRAQETTFNKISALFESKKQKIKESRSANEVFELLGISLWDSKPQATIRYQGKNVHICVFLLLFQHTCLKFLA
jgi:hypothetical protein